MALIPRAVKNILVRLMPHERAEMTLLTLTEAKEWAKEQRIAAEAESTTKLTAEMSPALYTLTSGDGEDPGFRRITSNPTLRDLNPMMHDRMQQVCYFLRMTTPFGKRIVEIITSYSVGKGVRITSIDPKVQAVISAFWDDDFNKLDEQLSVYCDELTTFGELCLPFNRNPIDGTVRLGYVDPTNIEAVRFGRMESVKGTVDISFPMAVAIRREVGEVIQRVLQIVRRDEDITSATWGKLQGECFYFAINKAKSASRGISELFCLADWIDVFDQMIFDFADKVRFLNAFVWHYTVEGANEEVVQDYKNKLSKNPPRQGGVQVTNEKVTMQAQTPQFHGADMAAGSQVVKKYGYVGAGLPSTFFGDGEDANRASALEMNAPAAKKFQDRQKVLAALIKIMLNYVIDSAVIAGTLTGKEDRTFTIEFPEIVVRDLQRGAQTLTGVGAAMQVGQQEGWVTGATAARAFHTILAEIGCDIPDSALEYTAAQAEKEARVRAQQELFAPQSALANALRTGSGPEDDDPEDDEELEADTDASGNNSAVDA